MYRRSLAGVPPGRSELDVELLPHRQARARFPSAASLAALVDVDEPCLRGAYAAEPHLPPLEEESSRLGRIRKSIQGLIYREGRGD